MMSDSSINVFSFRKLSSIMLIMALPWIMIYVSIFVAFGFSFVFYWPGLGILPFMYILIPLLGISYGCLIAIFKDVRHHLRAFAYAHGIFTSISSLTILMTFVFTKVKSDIILLRFPEFLKFSLPLWAAFLVYSMLYLIYATLAYKTLSKVVSNHIRSPSKDVLHYWKLSAILGLLTSITIICTIINSLVKYTSTDTAFLFVYPTIFAILLLILSLDELFLEGKFRHIRYPILAPLLAHTSWTLIKLPLILPKSIAELLFQIPFPALLLSPFPGITTSIGVDHVITGIVLGFIHYDDMIRGPSIPLTLFGLWLFFEFLAFYKILSYVSFKRSIDDIIATSLSLIFSHLLSIGGTIKVRFKVYKDNGLLLTVANMSHVDVIGIDVYVIGADWVYFDKPMQLDLVLKNGAQFTGLPPGKEITLVCYDWTRDKYIQAKYSLAVKVVCTFKDGAKMEKVYTVGI